MSLDLTDWQNKKYTTRDGRPVRLLCVDAHLRKGESIIGISTNADGTESADTWHKDGNYWTSSSEASRDDLINAKTKKEGLVNVYHGFENGHYATLYKSETSANLNASKQRIVCVKIEWES